MASPFRYFRKHTKVFMAVAVVLLMFIWVVGGAMSGGGPRRQRQSRYCLGRHLERRVAGSEPTKCRSSPTD